MFRTIVIALTGVAALSACGAGTAVPAGTPVRSVNGAQLAPYQTPIVTSPQAQAAEAAAKSTARSIKNSYGGVPTAFASLAFIDAPGGGDAVNLAIVGVQAVSNGKTYPLVTYDKPVVVNALDFQHSALQLGSNDIPAIAYDSLRFVVDESQSNVVKAGRTYPAVFGTIDKGKTGFVPSRGAIVSIDFAMPFTAAANTNVQLIMDFDAFESIRIDGNVADVAPVMHGTPLAKASIIGGVLVNPAGAPVVKATVQAVRDDGSVAATTASGTDGSFELHGMTAGSYHVVITNAFTTPSGIPVNAENTARTDSFAPASVYVPASYRCDLGRVAD